MTDVVPAPGPIRHGTRLVVGGVLDPAADLYIERQADETLRRHLSVGQSTLVIGSRCMGKTSLANVVGRSLEAAASDDPLQAATSDPPFRMAISDLDRDRVADREDLSTTERADRLLAGVWRNLRNRGHASGERPPAGCTLLAGMLQLAALDGDRPLLVVIDEFDRLGNVGPQGAELVRELRGVLQELRREAKLRSRLVLCILSVRGAHELFTSTVTDPAAGLELPAELIRLGPFEITDRTRDDLAKGFASYDPVNAVNIALGVLEVSGGYPQLCMELARRTIEEKAPYGPDFRRFLMDQVTWMRQEADPIRRRFFDLFEGFIREDPRLGAEALRVYRRILVAARDGGAEVPYRTDEFAQRLLEVAGLARSAEGVLRAYSPFLASYFDLEWADRIRVELETTRAVRGTRPIGRVRLSDRRLAVLVTGGTIGMVERDGRVRPPDDAEELAAEYREVNDLFDVSWEALADLDSSNVGPVQWSAWSREISERIASFDGVVVAHGTDTLAFTASAVAYALGDRLDVPVVFTGSQTTVDAVYGDARTNLLRACMVAASPPGSPAGLPEVVVSFGENIFRAVRAIKRDDRRFDAFESPAYPPLGIISEEVTLYSHLIRKVPGLIPGVRSTLDLRDQFVSGILVVSQVPGVLPEYYIAALEHSRKPVRGVVIQSLGAGNIPTEGDQSLVRFIRSACERGIPVLLASQYPIYPANLGKYGPPRQALAAGAIPVANMTTAALVSKLSWVLARLVGVSSDRLIEAVRSYMLTSQVGEIDDQDLMALGQIDLARIKAEDEVDDRGSAGAPR